MSVTRYTGAIIKQCAVAAVYFIVAIIVLNFGVVEEGHVTTIWPSSGIALAVLIRFGAKYALGVVMGGFAIGIYLDSVSLYYGLSILGNALEPLLALYLLRKLPFTPSLYRLHDYLSLVLAGSVGAVVSALLGTTGLILAGTIPVSVSLSVASHWWMGNALGVLLIAPFLLIISLHSYKKTIEGKRSEILLLLAVTTIVSFLVMTNWNHDLMREFGGTYLLIIPLAWSVLRFSQSMASIVIFEYFAIGVWGLLNQQGLFVNSSLEPNLTFFWVYFVIITFIAHAVAYSVSERNTLFQAINSSKTETYVFCEGAMTFEFVNQAALDNLGLSLSQALKLTPMDIKPLLSDKEFDGVMMPLVKKQLDVINFETVHQRADGTMYPVEVTIQSVKHANRDCYLASVVDITARVERDQHRALGNAVCDLSPQAIMITDSDNLIIRVNPVFTDITGYSFKEAEGESPHILSSGRHDDAFYRQVWGSLNTQGHWEGEIYNRRKNGELYLQRVSIKVLHEADGSIKNHIAMFRDITDERNQSKKLQYLAEHDVLTGLPNRMKLQQEFEFALRAAKRHRNKLAVLFFDLNDFKPINDGHGHMYGDDVLQAVADRVFDSIRDSDVVARIGGDEFVVLMTNIDSDDAIQLLIAKLKDVIVEPITVKEKTFTISASFGMAEYPKHGDTLDALLDVSDGEMYKDKVEMKKNVTG